MFRKLSYNLLCLWLWWRRCCRTVSYLWLCLAFPQHTVHRFDNEELLVQPPVPKMIVWCSLLCFQWLEKMVNPKATTVSYRWSSNSLPHASSSFRNEAQLVLTVCWPLCTMLSWVTGTVWFPVCKLVSLCSVLEEQKQKEVGETFLSWWESQSLITLRHLHTDTHSRWAN